jgi:nucleoside-diphosphate-sugar epimerase
MVRAIEMGAASEVYLVTDDDDRSVRALVEAIAASLRPPARVRTVAYGPVAAVATLGTWLGRVGLHTRVDLDALRKLTTTLTFSCEHAKRSLGYAPVIGFEAAVREAVADTVHRAAEHRTPPRPALRPAQ